LPPALQDFVLIVPASMLLVTALARHIYTVWCLRRDVKAAKERARRALERFDVFVV